MRAWRSIRARLLGLLLIGGAGVWLAAAAVTWLDLNHELDELLDAHLAQAAALLVVQQAGDFEGEDDRTVDAPSLHRYAPRAVFQVFHEGQMVLRSADAPAHPLVALAAAGGFSTVRTDGAAWRVFITRGRENDVQVIVGEQLGARSHIVQGALWSALWPLAVALPLLAVLAGWAVQRGLRPLRAIGAELAARPPNDLRPLGDASAPSELAPLLTALNGHLGRIDRMLHSERRFIADAAHELRTPIAAIRVQAQVAADETDAEARRHALRATLEGCDRAVRVVEQLLMLSRLEAGAEVRRQPVDLDALAQQLVAELTPRALRRHQDLGFERGGPGALAGDAVLLGVLLRNLIDNALRYSPEGASVTVSTARRDGQVHLVVEDGGPGLTESERARLGQRFARGEHPGASGSGLGWSIVQRIAQVHGMATTLNRSERLGGLKVTLSAPGTA